MISSSMIKSILLCTAYLTLLTIPSSGQLYNHLLSGERLNTGQAITQGTYVFVIQQDCNLVLYDSGNAIWASGTNGQGKQCYLAMQRDGNLVIYDNKNHAVWASNTNIGNGNYILIVQKDRNVVIYSQPIWATATNAVGLAGVVIAPTRNGTVLASGVEQNKAREMRKILKVTGDE